MYLAIDPGEHNRAGGSTGWALLDNHGEVERFGQIRADEITSWLNDMLKFERIEAVICEDFANFVWKGNHQRSRKNKTSVAIGRIEAICELHQVPLHKQPSSILTIGYKWAGIDPPSNHDISHQYSAIAHGVYWLQRNGIRKPGIAIPEDLK